MQINQSFNFFFFKTVCLQKNVLGRVLIIRTWTNSVINTILSLDQFKPIRIAENVVINIAIYEYFFSRVTYGIWLHVTVTWDQNRRRATIFFDGKENACKVADTGLSSYEIMNFSHSFYQIGNKKDGGETFHGLIRNLKVFKRMLNDSEILAEARGVNGTFECLP